MESLIQILKTKSISTIEKDFLEYNGALTYRLLPFKNIKSLIMIYKKIKYFAI